jgi:hypothetical protein
MTDSAVDFSVSAFESESGFSLVIEPCFFPAGWRMAIAADITVLTPVSVFSTMAVGTLHWELFPEVISVTGLTFGRPVFSMEFELRVLVMVEQQPVPSLGLVAVVAFSSKTPGVYVVKLVARKTVGRDPLVPGIGMALHAGDFSVSPFQGKIGRRVIEFFFSPRFRRVTVRTILSEPTTVHVVVSMAVDTLSRRIAKFLSILMTAFTGNNRVRAIERIIGNPVVEDIPVESQDVSIASQVIRVTELALHAGGTDITTMESAFSQQVGRHFAVADNAARLLFFLGERRMTFPAVLFQVCVAFCNRPRHEERLQGDTRADFWNKHQDCHHQPQPR